MNFDFADGVSVERLARSALLNEIYIEVGRTWSSKESITKGATTKLDVPERGLSMIPANITQNVLFVHTYQKKVSEKINTFFNAL